MRSFRSRILGFLVALSLGLSACDGHFVGPLTVDAFDGAPVVQPPKGVTFIYGCDDPSQRGLSETKMRRLTTPELKKTLVVLLGAQISSSSEVTAQLGQMTGDSVSNSVADVTEGHSPDHVRAMLNIATSAVEMAMANDAIRTSVFAPCVAGQAITQTCARTFVETFGLKALRRPVTSDERDNRFLKGFTPDEEGLKRALMRILLAPELAFHIELGGQRLGNRLRLSDEEVASRISYRVTGGPPDAELLAVARRAGALQDLDVVKAQVRRLYVETPQGRGQVDAFFDYYLQKEFIPEPVKLAHRSIDVVGLRAEMLTELKDFTDHVVWTKKGTFQDLFLSKEVFPQSDRMATILESRKVVGSAPSEAPDSHRGLLLRPALLAASGLRTSPLHRGAHLRKRLLCAQMGMPDPSAVSSRTDELGDTSKMTNRERFEKLTQASQCSGCHALINPVGFVLEAYDQLGMTRSQEVTTAPDHTPLTFAIDTNVTDLFLKRPDGSSRFENAAQLVEGVAASDEARACFAQTVFEFQRTRVSERADSCALRDTENAATYVGSVLDTFVTGVANEDIFWRAL